MGYTHLYKNHPQRKGASLTFVIMLTLAVMTARVAWSQKADFLVNNTPAEILGIMERVADWQLSHPATNAPTGWVQGAGYPGMMALAGLAADPKYREAMLSMGETNGWEPGPRRYHADDQCVGQTYAELYLLYREPKMIGPLRARFDDILAHPPKVQSLNFSNKGDATKGRATDLWSWCDSLFMAPPTWMRLYAATDDPRYLDYAVTNWWRTTDYLYDSQAHLFFRDSTFFKKKEANGAKVFWSRGNGWVMAGLVRMLEYLPQNHPERPRFEKLFKDMAGAVASCQQPDGLWRASLLDPDSFPLKEASGSGFFTYALAWGVNHGLLTPADYAPVVQRGWAAMESCVEEDGKLTNVQPVGSDPRGFAPDSTAPYGTGAFLLAGSEVYRMALAGVGHWQVKVTNPSAFARDDETVDVDPFKLTGANGAGLAVMDGQVARLLDSQTYTEPEDGSTHFLFQVNLGPGETRSYDIWQTNLLAVQPVPIQKTYAREVPERHDDFAWESDRIAHRMYGQALETWAAEPLTSSGIDVWIKRTRALIINRMYGSGRYYNTNGASQDDYRVGRTRGCGGLGLWVNGKLSVSKNWRSCRLITSGPVRSEFELGYEMWDADGRMVTQTNRISIDGGSNMSRVESRFSSPTSGPLTVGVGLAERPGENVFVEDRSVAISDWTNSTDRGLVVRNEVDHWMTYWQPQDFNKGTTAVAIILPNGDPVSFTNDLPNLSATKLAAPTKTVTEGQPALRNLLAVTTTEVGQPLTYYIGAGWDQSGDFPTAEVWNDYVRRYAERLAAPLKMTIEP